MGVSFKSIPDKMDLWLKNGFNVLLEGGHGCGKSSLVIDTFNRAGIKWRYFSTSTMDPWVDFIGVPREKTVDGKTYLELVRPQDFADDTIEALFFDEFNRSPKKVRNAVMELIQFRSINGKAFKNLKVIWAAINPEADDIYDVEKLDPAQADRFHIQVRLDSVPNPEWFVKRFGEHKARAAIDWWKTMDADFQKLVSPRRLEYALLVHERGCDLRDTLPNHSGISRLIENLNQEATPNTLKKLYDAKDVAKARKYLANANALSAAMNYIPANEGYMTFFLPLLDSKEQYGKYMADNDTVCNHVISNSDKVPLYMEVCKEILAANASKKLCDKIRKALTENQHLAIKFGSADKAGSPDAPVFNPRATTHSLDKRLAEIGALSPTVNAARIYVKDFENFIPEKMSSTQALNLLQGLSKLLGSLPASSFQSLATLPGVVNHCLDLIHAETGLDGPDILKTHGHRFRNLLERLNDCGMASRLAFPERKRAAS